MDKEKLIQQAKDPRYISGIHNYCDRWCERCQFTSRCLNCSLVEEEFGDLKEIDIQNQEFWQRFTNLLQSTFEMIIDMAKDAGIDIESFDDENRVSDDSITQKNRVPDLLVPLAEKYIEFADSWFKSNEYQLYNKDYHLKQIRLLSKNENPEKELSDIMDATEVIGWYQYQILVKTKRASENTSEDLLLYEYEFSKDADGSAKVALIGIDRSISAWNVLSFYFSDNKKEIVKMIILLENLRKRTELNFPNARKFVRPGFDDNKEMLICSCSGSQKAAPSEERR